MDVIWVEAALLHLLPRSVCVRIIPPMFGGRFCGVLRGDASVASPWPRIFVELTHDINSDEFLRRARGAVKIKKLPPADSYRLLALLNRCHRPKIAPLPIIAIPQLLHAQYLALNFVPGSLQPWRARKLFRCLGRCFLMLRRQPRRRRLLRTR